MKLFVLETEIIYWHLRLPSYTNLSGFGHQMVDDQQVFQTGLPHKTKHQQLLHYNPYLEAAVHE